MGKPLSFFDLPESANDAHAEHATPHQHPDAFEHRAGDPAHHSDHAFDDLLSDQQGYPSDARSDLEAFVFADLVGDSGDMASALDFAAKLDHAQRQDLPGLGKATGTGAKRKGQGEFVTFESFEEGPPREAYKVIERFGRALLFVGEDLALKAKSIDFFFVPSEDRITFFDCCEAIDPSIRPGVLLLRLQYEFWRKWFVFPNPLPEGACGLPEQAKGPASFAAGPEGVWVAQEAWFHPGIDTRRLIERSRIVSPISSEASLRETVGKLEAAGVLCHSEPDHWYATGRNPTLTGDGETRKTGGSVVWSAMF